MAGRSFKLGEETLTPERLVQLGAEPSPPVTVMPATYKRVASFRARVDAILASEDRHYGINTGFGYLSDVPIADDKLEALQRNLIRSHACGVGEMTPPQVVRSLLVLRAHTFALGHSGISRECLEALLGLLENDILPCIPSKGSVGASGDLAPLAHLALGLMGEGDVLYRGETVTAAQALKHAKLKPYKPKPKEGLSLINGTHYMTAIGVWSYVEAKTLIQSADAIAAMSLDAIRGTLRAFDMRVQDVRPQPGQKIVAQNFAKLFKGKDEVVDSHKDCAKVQDPYSFRCVPQVHGASRDVLAFVGDRLTGDCNSVTDNPLIFDNGDIISGGNFHGQPVAMALDFLAIAVSEIGSISERRTEKLTNPTASGLPAFLVNESGLNSGFMIPHVVAAALVSENKILCHPASVDSIPTSANKEDHVSMGPISARKSRQVNSHVASILAIECLAACQGLDLLRPLKPSAALQRVHKAVRAMSPPYVQDRSLHKDMELLAKWLLNGGIQATLSEGGLELA